MSKKTDSRWDGVLREVERWRSSMSPGAVANLRRCVTIDEVFLNPDYHRLAHGLPQGPDSPVSKAMLPVLAALTAHVDPEDAPPLAGIPADEWIAEQLGPRDAHSQPKLHEVRFRRLLAEDDVEALLPALRRIVVMMKGRIPIAALWKGFSHWNSSTRRRLASGYYKNL